MLDIFQYMCLADIVLGTHTWPTHTGKDQDKFYEKEKKTMMLIKSSMKNEMLLEVQTRKTYLAIQKHLRELHEASNKGKAIFLKNVLFSIMMNENASHPEHLFKIKDIKEQLMTIGQKIKEKDMVVITLKSLLRVYEHFIETLNVTSTNVDLKFDELCNNLLQQDGWKKHFDNNNERQGAKQTFVSNFKDKGK